MGLEAEGKVNQKRDEKSDYNWTRVKRRRDPSYSTSFIAFTTSMISFSVRETEQGIFTRVSYMCGAFSIAYA